MDDKKYELRAKILVEMDESEHDDSLARLASFAGMYFRDLQVPHRHFTGREVRLKYQSPTARLIRVRNGLYSIWVSFLCRAEKWQKRAEVIEQATTILSEFTAMRDDLGPSVESYEPVVESVRIVRRLHDEVVGRNEKEKTA